MLVDVAGGPIQLSNNKCRNLTGGGLFTAGTVREEEDALAAAEVAGGAAGRQEEVLARVAHASRRRRCRQRQRSAHGHAAAAAGGRNRKSGVNSVNKSSPPEEAQSDLKLHVNFRHQLRVQQFPYS